MAHQPQSLQRRAASDAMCFMAAPQEGFKGFWVINCAKQKDQKEKMCMCGICARVCARVCVLVCACVYVRAFVRMFLFARVYMCV